MSVLLLQDDFITPGVLGSPYASIQGNGFTSDGIRVYANTVAGAECQSTLVQSFTITTASGQMFAEYEIDVTTPSLAWPVGAGTSWVAGMSMLQASTGRDGLTFTLKRATTGPTTTFQLDIRHPTVPASDFAVAHVGYTALNLGQTYRLKAQITFNASFLGINLYIDGTLVWPAAITLTQFNTTTGRGLGTLLGSAKLPGLFTDIDGNPPADATTPPSGGNGQRGYLDRIRLRDIGPGAVQVDSSPAYTLDAPLVLTPISVGAEDNSTGDAFPTTATLQPDRPSIPDDQWLHVEFLSDGGHVVSFPEGSQAERIKFPWTWQTLSEADRTTLSALHASLYGRHKAFSYTYPETGEVLKLKFTAPLVTRQVGRGGASGARIYSASTEVQMVRV